jgi:hypothetical protein
MDDLDKSASVVGTATPRRSTETLDIIETLRAELANLCPPCSTVGGVKQKCQCLTNQNGLQLRVS